MKEKNLIELGIKNVIFDHCGTLINNLYLTYKITMFIFEKLGIKEITLEEFKRESEIPFFEFYQKFTDATKEEIDKLFVEGCKSFKAKIEVSLFPGISDMLNFFEMEDITMAILSSYMKEEIELNLRRLGIRNYFSKVIGDADDKVEGLQVFLGENNIEPKKAAYVGDMPYDIIAGQKAGLGMTVAVLWGFGSKEKLMEADPDYLLKNPADIWRLFV
ncbi:hypothetical protein COX24_02400 [bacterium (Candidatus Gribaldobacteria) CG23_combo_of_CG06-09_8_20_14_all_37_87_8]|uniref:HAD family hydrolase n=2 Tax=Candidatus Gribaldobacteria TaxID=2798536 RepID=A0A2G9ZER0_9BACT|nr:MAG: hypothetical protein AUJ25_00310 [Parcubacteria group bacterium CG1_02_37_13]PIP31653.1 MAG: hypothetical protein COX24_02400 [bacterium (Candidatus Gribaldobacteria) CG23_combo_of_CG06-09_8_20_14_all_37_87_8]PIR90586.1 MAG: hypothetical protein COU05_01430 [bacterium (Candidatus Gribaldobacteria) CG10_big_fil_rev_8_21_14_0_10_37_21]